MIIVAIIRIMNMTIVMIINMMIVMIIFRSKLAVAVGAHSCTEAAQTLSNRSIIAKILIIVIIIVIAIKQYQTYH